MYRCALSIRVMPCVSYPVPVAGATSKSHDDDARRKWEAVKEFPIGIQHSHASEWCLQHQWYRNERRSLSSLRSVTRSGYNQD